ncbi:MAG: heme o synthase [Simkaniaceae bacterium]|nr:heme o synthase [Simkaniaceae bacterium]
MIKAYYILSKPGIIYGNAITVIAGFLLASQGAFHSWLFFATLIGLSCVIASACTFNNYIDRMSDRKMRRTQNRPLVIGSIPNHHALIFGASLAFCGFFMLLVYTNLLTTLIAVVGFAIYVFAYSLLKYHSVHATLIGSLAGAVPPVIGYTAVTNHFDLAAFLLFAILTFWQMPHFYAIAIHRIEDYAAASIPVLPIQKGLTATKIQSFAYIIAFFIASISLTYFHYTGTAYFITMGLLSIAWAILALKGFRAQNERLWARRMFLFSLIIILFFSLTLSLSNWV